MEHFATLIIRPVIGHGVAPVDESETARSIVIATPVRRPPGLTDPRSMGLVLAPIRQRAASDKC